MSGTVNAWSNQINGSYNQIILNAGTNGVAISTDASAATVNVATGAAVKTLTMGSTNSTSATTVQSGSGALTLTTNGGNANIVLTPNGTGVVTTANALRTASISFDSGTNVLSTFVTSTSWTPVLSFGGASVGITYGTQQGTYTRIGNMVHAQLNITLTSKGSSTGGMSIAGLPFTVAQTVIGTVSGSGITWTAGNVIVSSFTASSLTCRINQTSPIVGTPAALDDTNFTNTATIRISGTYFV